MALSSRPQSLREPGSQAVGGREIGVSPEMPSAREPGVLISKDRRRVTYLFVPFWSSAVWVIPTYVK